MGDKKALDALINYALLNSSPQDHAVAAALAHLQGKHAYFSRFKPGDEVFRVAPASNHPGGKSWYVESDEIVLVSYSEESDEPSYGYLIDFSETEGELFPTREEAQAECDKRNKAGA